ncbi:FAD-dependent oxidoreductase [Aspergillus stella-maris]|uniref:FAD-dependent oxidoreductase n=1 Tax=Aspergillus stella-maris TaxID=1810926 RepID=UPI003CCD39EF
MSIPRIAIIGAGPADLTLSLLLHKQSIQNTIYELRPKPTSELPRSSGSLDLHEESGLVALREAGLYESFQFLSGECSEAQRVFDQEGSIIYEDEGELSERPEIERDALTNLLTNSLPENTIRYGHKLLSVTEMATKGVELDFGRNGTAIYDLVIGADGAWSRVRNALTAEKPNYTGTQLITGTITNISTRFPRLADLVGKGNEDYPTTSGLKDTSLQAAKETLLTDEKLLGSFGQTIKNLASTSWEMTPEFTSNDKLNIKPLYTLPPNTSFPHPKGSNITLIGDAAHLMPPWAGEGVNLAMWDSLLLSRAITTAFEESRDACAETFLEVLSPLLLEFEEEMFSRAGEKAEETKGNGEMMFSEDGAKVFKKFFESVYGAQDGEGGRV